MTLPKNKALRIGLLSLFNLLLLIGLMIGLIIFQFLVLGWGASANSPYFNTDISLIVYLIILGILTFTQKSKERRSDLMWVLLIVTGLYISIKLGTQIL